MGAAGVDAGRALLRWYSPRRHAYPWRTTRDAYRVLVSEIMLQQTQATRVAAVFDAFISRFPDVRALAAASRAEVLTAWGDLGYNRRAVALSETARAIVRDRQGRIPLDQRTLMRLPGVGPYTAAAVASIAHREPVAAVDTNVARIVRRVFVGGDGTISSARLRELATAWLDGHDPAAWNQALMDLGRSVCRPQPRCELCPLAGWCRFASSETRPRSRARRQSPFEGSSRQVRGAIVRILRERRELTLSGLAARSGEPLERVVAAVDSLAREGIVHAGPAALRGSGNGRVRLGA